LNHDQKNDLSTHRNRLLFSAKNAGPKLCIRCGTGVQCAYPCVLFCFAIQPGEGFAGGIVRAGFGTSGDGVEFFPGVAAFQAAAPDVSTHGTDLSETGGASFNFAKNAGVKLLVRFVIVVECAYPWVRFCFAIEPREGFAG